jgi:hypothetical protein
MEEGIHAASNLSFDLQAFLKIYWIDACALFLKVRFRSWGVGRSRQSGATLVFSRWMTCSTFECNRLLQPQTSNGLQ